MIPRIIRRIAESLSPVTKQTGEARLFPVDWLVRPVSILEAEDHEGLRSMERWNDLTAVIQPGDEIWLFCSPPRTWEVMMGREGYVLLRNGKEIDRVVTVMN